MAARELRHHQRSGVLRLVKPHRIINPPAVNFVHVGGAADDRIPYTHLDGFPVNAEELLCPRDQLLFIHIGIALGVAFPERLNDAGLNPLAVIPVDAQFFRQLIRRFKADAADIPDDAVRVLEENRHGLIVVGVVELHRHFRRNAVLLKLDQHLPNVPLILIGAEHPAQRLLTDAGNFQKPGRIVV